MEFSDEEIAEFFLKLISAMNIKLYTYLMCKTRIPDTERLNNKIKSRKNTKPIYRINYQSKLMNR